MLFWFASMVEWKSSFVIVVVFFRLLHLRFFVDLGFFVGPSTSTCAWSLRKHWSSCFHVLTLWKGCRKSWQMYRCGHCKYLAVSHWLSLLVWLQDLKSLTQSSSTCKATPLLLATAKLSRAVNSKSRYICKHQYLAPSPNVLMSC